MIDTSDITDITDVFFIIQDEKSSKNDVDSQ